MPVQLRIIEHDAVSLAAIESAVRDDRDCQIDGTVTGVPSLDGAEIAIVNLDDVAPCDLTRLELIGAPQGVVLISTSRFPERLETVRGVSAALLFEPLTASDVGAAVAVAKQSVLLRRFESLSKLLAAYTHVDSEANPLRHEKLPRCEAIDWIEADGNYVKIHTADCVHRLRMTMAQVEAEFNNSTIVRGHRTWLVNLTKVAGLKSDNSGSAHVELRSGEELPVGRAYRKSLRRSLRQLANELVTVD